MHNKTGLNGTITHLFYLVLSSLFLSSNHLLSESIDFMVTSKPPSSLDCPLYFEYLRLPF